MIAEEKHAECFWYLTVLRLIDNRMKPEEQVGQLKATPNNGITVGPLPTIWILSKTISKMSAWKAKKPSPVLVTLLACVCKAANPGNPFVLISPDWLNP